ncbi:hypothetical protein CDD81_3784 [Ophiocordyceps australis]|uniref:Beta-glucosidase cel3A n=1 Tax=Ophiocordyceps australis TaxID=1399860 RepID=A0A2C5Y892_9HYPO|nr:hypothetical protein CDD81_3784 [Ophiocordyceps australis]
MLSTLILLFSATAIGGPSWPQAQSLASHLIHKMSLAEAANITYGFPHASTCAGLSGSVPRLHFPGLCLHDAGNGVRAAELVSAYPAALHAGAAWDSKLAYQRAYYMGREFRAKGINLVLGPNAGPLGRTPLGGRNWEGFSVDPYLSGQLIAETVRGLQDAGVMANLKHWIGNEQETLRRPYHGIQAVSSNIDDRALHELYMWPFMDGIRAGAASVMCAYNRVNGSYACNSAYLLTHLLKHQLAFAGFVLLDWNAQHSIDSANAGLDMVMPYKGAWGDALLDAVRSGNVSETRLRDMATRILAAWFLVRQDGPNVPPPGFGMFNLSAPHKPIEARVPASKPVLLEGAIAGHVLVKNEQGALPFRRPLVMLSVFGYDAAAPVAKNVDFAFKNGFTSSRKMAQAPLGSEQHFDQAAKGGTIIIGGRAGATSPPYISDPLRAIQQRAEADNTWVNWDVTSLEPDVNGASEACLVFVNAMATEAWDREGLHDDASDGLVLSVASRCANTTVVIHAAGIRLVDGWINHPNVSAAIIAHLPGQDSGRALVALLYGETNFSGRLPYTLARNESDYPVYKPCGLASAQSTDPQCDFSEGLYLDYRAFDARNVTPRYEFGFGLGYTTFGYSSLAVSTTASLRPSTSNSTNLWEIVATVDARIANTGSVAGAEVAQLYLGIPNSPPKQLRGFQKVLVEPQRSVPVRFALTRRDLSLWDVVQQQWVVQRGEYSVYVGASSRDVRLTSVIVLDD